MSKNVYVNKSTVKKILEVDKKSAAILSKLTKKKTKKKNYNYDPIEDMGYFKESMKASSEKLNVTKDFLKIFPDLELATEILITMVLSSKDMASTQLIYKTKNKTFPPDVVGKLLLCIKNEISEHYKIEDKLSKILRSIITGPGSYIRAVIPENSLDDIINGYEDNISTESLAEIFDSGRVKNLGFIGNGDTKKYPSIEDLFDNSIDASTSSLFSKEKKDFTLKNLRGIEVVDNYNIMKLPSIIKAANEKKVDSILNSNRIKPYHVFKPIQGREKKSLFVKGMRDSSREAIHRPLVLDLPSESVIPVFVPGSVSDHIGYYVLLDENGSPIVAKKEKDKKKKDFTKYGISEEMQSTSIGKELMKTASKNLGNDEKEDAVGNGMKLFNNTIERMLIDKLESGIYKTGVNIEPINAVYQLLLRRVLKERNTKIIFLPADICTYFALRYDDRGIGENFLDDICVISSMRAVLLFSKVLGTIKNNIPTTNVLLKLDEEDPNPPKSIELATSEILKTRQMDLPIGISSAPDLVDWIHRVGFSFSFEEHPGIPQVSFDFQDVTKQRDVSGGDELMEDLKKQQYSKLGLTPEIVENGFGSDFASTDEANRILLAKRLKKTRNEFMVFVSKHISNIVLSDAVIMDQLFSILDDMVGLVKLVPKEDRASFKANKQDYINIFLETMITNLVVDLVTGDDDSITATFDQFKEYIDALDEVLAANISPEILPPEIVGDAMAEQVDDLILSVKGHYIREWCNEHGFMIELASLTTIDSAGNPSLNLGKSLDSHIEGVTKTLVDYLNHTRKLKDKTEKAMEKIMGDVEEDDVEDIEEIPDENVEDDIDDVETDGDKETDVEDTGEEPEDKDDQPEDEADGEDSAYSDDPNIKQV